VHLRDPHRDSNDAVQSEKHETLHIIRLSVPIAYQLECVHKPIEYNSHDKQADENDGDEKDDGLKVLEEESERVSRTAQTPIISPRHARVLCRATHIQPMTTRRGTTNAAIWIDEPTQMPMVSSILFFMAIHTEVTCSAAFATIGMRTRPMKALGM
jgi:hypothetical protein